jgi:hypothetical protein
MNFYFPTNSSLIKINRSRMIEARRGDNMNYFAMNDTDIGQLIDFKKIGSQLSLKLDDLYANLFPDAGLEHKVILLSGLQFPNNQMINETSYSLCFFIIGIITILKEHFNTKFNDVELIITGSIFNTDWNYLGSVNEIADKIKSTVEYFHSNPVKNRKALFIYVNDPIDITILEKMQNQRIKFEVSKRENNFILKLKENQTLRIKSISNTSEIFNELLGSEWRAFLGELEVDGNVKEANSKQLPNTAYIKGTLAFDENDYEIFTNLQREKEKLFFLKQ